HVFGWTLELTVPWARRVAPIDTAYRLVFVAGGALFLRDQARGLSLLQSPISLSLMSIGLVVYLLTRLGAWMNRMR
ncbi:MAG: hypothetical protein AAF438_16635, partial [Pseudomonadota bacterium]